MPHGYLIHFLSSAIQFASLVQSQKASCYVTSTVIYGNGQSFADNVTASAPIATTYHTLTGAPGFGSLSTYLNSANASSLASEQSTLFSNVLSTGGPSTTSATTSQTSSASSSPTVSTLPSPLYLQVNTGNNAKLRKRSVEYVAFSGNNGILVATEDVAAIFELMDGFLMNGGEYVSQGTGDGYGLFEKSEIPPATAQDWSAAGSAIAFANTSFCYTSDNSFYIVSGLDPPAGCQAAALTASETSVTATTSTSIMDVLSTSNSVVPVSSLSSPSTTSGEPPVQTSNLVLPSSASIGSSSTSSVLSSTSYQVSTSTVISVSIQASNSPSTPTPKLAISTSCSVSTVIPILSSSQISSSSFGGQNTSVSASSASVSAPPISSSSSSTVSATVLSIHTTSTSTSLFTSIPNSSLTPPSSSTSSNVPSLNSSTIASSSPSTSISQSSSTSLPASISITSTATTSGIMTPSISLSSLSSSTISIPSNSSSLRSTTITTTSTTTSSKRSTTTTTTPLSTQSPLPGTPLRNTGKRGLAYTNVTNTQFFSLASPNHTSHVSWCYDYYSLPNATNTNPGPLNPALTYIPLLYNDAPSLTSIWVGNVNTSIGLYRTDAVLAFNEPDACNSGQSACMSVSESVSAYRAFIHPLAGTVKLGAPAVTNGPAPASLTYLSYFLGNCTGCTIDFVPLHWYASPYSFQYLKDYVNEAYAVGGQREIWITELGMDSQKYADADVQVFMKNATAWLDAQPFVARYSWFGDFEGYLLNANGAGLSAQGMIWDSYSGGYVYP